MGGFTEEALAEVFKLEPTLVEIEAATTMTEAFAIFVAGGSILPAVEYEEPVGDEEPEVQDPPPEETSGNTASMGLAKIAMIGALLGMSTPGQGAQKIQDGITAFWTALIPFATATWPTVPPILPAMLTIPPRLGEIAALLQAQAAKNIEAKLEKDEAALAIAKALLPTQLNATVVLSLPPPSGTPGVPIQ